MQTRIALLERALQEAQAAPADISGIEMFLIVSGAVAWVFLLFAAVRFFVLRWVERGIDQDIHPAVLCTCPSPKCSLHPNDWNRGNRTATLSFAEMKARKTDHPCLQSVPSKAPRDVKPEQRASRGGGDTREGA